MSALEEKVSAILGPYRDKLARDYMAYHNHVLRVITLGGHLGGRLSAEEENKLIIAASFHDLGIWTANTFDYLAPSIVLAGEYLDKNGLSRWREEISLMISEHHKITLFRDERFPLVEVFRRADWIDVSLGGLTFGLEKKTIRGIRKAFPNAGFHKKLIQLTAREFLRKPLRPLPMFKW